MIKSFFKFRLRTIITGKEATLHRESPLLSETKICDCVGEPRRAMSASWEFGLHPALRVCDDYIGLPSGEDGHMIGRTLYEELIEIFAHVVRSYICGKHYSDITLWEMFDCTRAEMGQVGHEIWTTHVLTSCKSGSHIDLDCTEI